MKTYTASVTAGVWPAMDEWFRGAAESKTAARSFLKKIPPAPDMQRWYAGVAPTRESNSEVLWRWRVAPKKDNKNTSQEKIIEKAAANLLSWPEWANQIPAASGLSTDRGDCHRNIDLGQKIGDGAYRLIELKFGSNHPVFAAHEMIAYFLLYWWVRQHPETWRDGREDRELMAAKEIRLEVLAPLKFYHGWPATQLYELSDVLDKGLASLTKGYPKASFRFAVLGELNPKEEAHWTRELLEKAFVGSPLPQ